MSAAISLSDNRVENDALDKPKNAILEQLEETSKEVNEMKKNLGEWLNNLTYVTQNFASIKHAD